jgi:hypothetical protein
MVYTQLVTPNPKDLLENIGVCDKPRNYITPITQPVQEKNEVISGSFTGGPYQQNKSIKINALGPKRLITRSY